MSSTEAAAAPAKPERDPVYVLTVTKAELAAGLSPSGPGPQSDAVLAVRGFSEFIAQPVWEKRPEGGFKQTGEVGRGYTAGEALLKDFGPGEYRNLVLDKVSIDAKASTGRDASFDSLDKALELSTARRAQKAAEKAAAKPAKEAGASR